MIEFKMHYSKALKVVNSCTQPEHIIGAHRYVHSLAQLYSDEIKEGVYEFHNVEIVDYINFLLKKLDEKSKEYSC